MDVADLIRQAAEILAPVAPFLNSAVQGITEGVSSSVTEASLRGRAVWRVLRTADSDDLLGSTLRRSPSQESLESAITTLMQRQPELAELLASTIAATQHVVARQNTKIHDIEQTAIGATGRQYVEGIDGSEVAGARGRSACDLCSKRDRGWARDARQPRGADRRLVMHSYLRTAQPRATQRV
jgi:hypothetical protein